MNDLTPANMLQSRTAEPRADRSLDMIENHTIDEIKVGDTARLMRTLLAEDMQLFATMSGDVNPAHLDLIAPNLEAGNMMTKQLQYLADAQAAGLAHGARVPVILTSRADSTGARIASCALALLVVKARAADRPAA